jgi:hypothetical protein
MSLCEVGKSVIQDVLEEPFLRRTLTEELKITIKDRRPCPPISNLKSIHNDKEDT